MTDIVCSSFFEGDVAFGSVKNTGLIFMADCSREPERAVRYGF